MADDFALQVWSSRAVTTFVGRTNYPGGHDDSSVEAALDRALATDGLRCWFQPLVDARTHRIVAFESLVRCVDPRIGLILPSALLPVARATGQMAAIDAWMLDRSCARLSIWDRAFPELDLRVSVNVSAALLERSAAFVGLVERTLALTQLQPGRLRLEMADVTLLDATPAALGALAELRGSGVAVGLDDLDTGSQALGRLDSLPVDFVTIDGALVRRSTDDVEAHAVVGAITRLAHAHDLSVIAEGVETVLQARTMTDLGCDELQGFLFSRPTPAEDLTVGFDSLHPPTRPITPVLL